MIITSPVYFDFIITTSVLFYNHLLANLIKFT